MTWAGFVNVLSSQNLRRTKRSLGRYAEIIWHSVNVNPKAGGQTLRGKLQHHDRSRYTPHQGAQERARRLQRG